MVAPDVSVLLDTGERVALKILFASEPIGLVFLRHLGCVFCRRQVSLLRRRPDLNVAFVCMAKPEEAQAFRERQKLDRPMICDSERKLYEAFSLPRATARQVIAPKVVLRSLAAARHGMGRPENDPLQLGGAFVADVDGSVIWSHRQRDISDLPSAEEIASALSRARAAA